MGMETDCRFLPSNDVVVSDQAWQRQVSSEYRMLSDVQDAGVYYWSQKENENEQKTFASF